jgi:glycosyltransferase involved in cell wall biosynthesis
LTKDVILLSTADWDNPFWTNKQHMAVNFADEGFRVLYIESVGLRKPTAKKKDFRRIINRLRKGLRGLHEVRESIWVCSPIVIPLHGNPIIRFFNRFLLLKMIQHSCNRLRFKAPMFWTYNPLSLDIAKKIQASLTVYHCVDDLSSAPGMPSNTIRSEEEKLVQYADLVFTTSPRLQDRCSASKPEDTYFFPNVVDFDHFSKAATSRAIPDDLLKIPKPRIGFIGAISYYKVDFDLIAFVARSKPEWHWVMIGEIGEGQPETTVEKLNMKNIHFLGPKEYALLPDYLRGFDIAAIPSPVNDYTASMFPMKFFEYLSAGKPVVSTNLPALQSYGEMCRLVGSPEEFISAVDAILAGNAPHSATGMAFAKKHTWQWRLGEMLSLLEQRWTSKYPDPAGRI